MTLAGLPSFTEGCHERRRLARDLLDLLDLELQDLFGIDRARKALADSITNLTKERARFIDQRLVEAGPAQALLEAVGNNPANLIVVGNRGLGATGDELLGSVPGEVVKKAVCDVLIVQTSALDEERRLGSTVSGADDVVSPDGVPVGGETTKVGGAGRSTTPS